MPVCLRDMITQFAIIASEKSLHDLTWNLPAHYVCQHVWETWFASTPPKLPSRWHERAHNPPVFYHKVRGQWWPHRILSDKTNNVSRCCLISASSVIPFLTFHPQNHFTAGNKVLRPSIKLGWYKMMLYACAVCGLWFTGRTSTCACMYCRHTGKLDRVWIIVTLVQSVQSACAWGSKAHLVFSLYRLSPFVMAYAAVLSVFCGGGTEGVVVAGN